MSEDDLRWSKLLSQTDHELQEKVRSVREKIIRNATILIMAQFR